MKITRRRIQKARRKAEKRAAAELTSRENERRRRAERTSAPLCESGLCAHRAQYINGGKMLCRYHAER